MNVNIFLTKTKNDMSDYTKIKSMVKVFKSYGIEYPSKVKKAGFEKELGFDRIFVGGLIFDMEEAIQVYLGQEEADLIENPLDVIQHMLGRTDFSQEGYADLRKMDNQYASG